MHKPEVAGTLSVVGNVLEVELVLDRDLDWFQGHFPVQPILPGLAQTIWVREYAQKLLPGCRLSAIPQMKFMAPMIPGDHVVLRVERVNDSLVRFAFRLADSGAVMSSGKLRLLP